MKTPTAAETDILNDIIGDVTDIKCDALDDELRCAETAEDLDGLAVNLADAEVAAQTLLKEIQKLRKKLAKLRNV